MSVTLVRLILSAALVAAISCDAPANTATSATLVASATPARAASPDPARLPKPGEEQMIAQALAQAGIRVASAFPSKFDWLFGDDAPRSGTFQGAIDGTQVWADVHFLNGKLDGITACSGPGPTGETAFTVSVKGRPQVLGSGNATGYLGSAGPMYFAASERVFLMTPDAYVRDALRSALALSEPPCIWREPATLPVFPEEQAVIAALNAAGIRLTLIGASKFEDLLGERQRARVFIEQAGAGGAGADVLFLERPVGTVRVCTSQTGGGLNRYEIFIGDRLVSSGEGTQTISYSFSDRYFIQAFGNRFHTALMQELGTAEPPC